MASLREIRKALQGLLPNCLIDIVEEYVPHIELTFTHSLAEIATSPIAHFRYRDDTVHVSRAQPMIQGTAFWPLGYGIYYRKAAFPPFTIDFRLYTYPLLRHETYTVEFDPIGQSIVSVIHNPTHQRQISWA